MRGRIISVAVPAENAPAPVSVATMKQHLRISHTAEDTLIDDYIAAAVASIGIDGELGRAIGVQTIDEALSRPTRDTYLSVTPAQDLVAVKYFDVHNAEQTADLAGFEFYKSDDWAFVRSNNWPATYDRPDAVTISYTAGAENVPADIVHALKMIVGHWYEHRADASVGVVKEIPRAAAHLLSLHRVGWYG